jgi:S-DNA-T family DNA segregation ATPase FtsK/SpoIIIE
MHIRLSVTSVRDEARDEAGQDCADAAVVAAAGTPFSAAAGALRALAGVTEGRFFAGAVPVPDDAPLGTPPLLDGTLLTVGGPGAPTALPGGLELHVAGGPDAGGVHLIAPPAPGADPARISIGRGADAQIRIDDPDLSRLHAALVVTADWVRLRDTGSTNGTTLDGNPVGEESVLLLPDTIVRLGETTLILRSGHRSVEAEPDRLGRLRVRTEHRDAVTLAAPRFELPPLPPNRGLPARRRRAAAAFELAKSAAEKQIADALAAEAALRRERHADLAALLTAAIRPEPRLWSRDPAAGGLLDLRLGTARIASRVTVVSGPKTFRPRVPAAPVTVDLEAAGVLGLVGPRPQLSRFARALVAQLAACCAPRDLELVILSGEEQGGARRAGGESSRVESGRWQWTRWLPHVSPQDGQDCRALVGLGPDQARARVAELVAKLDSRQADAGAGYFPSGSPDAFGQRWTGRRSVVVLDPAPALLDLPGVQRLLHEGPEFGIYAIVLAPRPAELPDATGAMAVLNGDVYTRVRLERPEGPSLDNIIADLASTQWAERFGRALAPLRESDDLGAPQLPEEARLLALLGLDLLTPAKLGARWALRPACGEATLGADDHGPVRADLTGQHVLVAGAAGSGVSEVLRTITCGLAAVNRPQHLRITLVSGGRGPSLAGCAALVHTEAHLSAEASSDDLRVLLDRLEGEVELRIRAARRGAVADPSDPAHPRLLVVVDGFDALAAAHPWFAKGLAVVARDGRDHDVHLIVGVTLEHAQAVRLLDSELCQEAQIRIALRTHETQESRKLVSLPAAASIRADTPGRAQLALPDGRVLPIQTALISGRMPSSASSRASAARLPWTELGAPLPRRLADGSPIGTAPGGPTDLALLVETARRAASR